MESSPEELRKDYNDEIWDVTYKRRYYEDKKTGEKAYLADRAAVIQKYERIDVALKAEITDLSTMMSYEKSTREIKSNLG
ncbi:hypothetical protein ATZ99_08670 [Thermovenabulum gondwanense]|uniref:Uncharacterized protein n=1 Tax=Thermovenabulum gondwanense TaxID=520767 RepID=A0A162MS08_9FIRM|nr:hypothetical protein ATZ99_08670 [Thermovenabulum gondwanense]